MFGSQLHQYFEPSDTPRSRVLLEAVGAAGRAEARAAAARLDAIGELFELRRAERGEREDWAVDTWAAVSAEVSAGLCISPAMAGSYLHYGVALRRRLPAVGEVFKAGDIDYRTFQTIVYRTDLITDRDVLAEVDKRLGAAVGRWPAMTQGKLANAIDKIVARVDPDAVRRAREQAAGREVTIWGNQAGIAELYGKLFVTDAAALDARLNALAATVCEADPRTTAQRRADALGALAAGADRLACQCGTEECGAGGHSPGAGVLIHVIAEQASVQGTGTAPALLAGSGELIPAELVAVLAKTAKLAPLSPPPIDAPPEKGYTPSAKLAAFVRARDLTCRAPGCERPAHGCDLDHTIPHAQGGATHASNLKCLCRFHHLLKTFWGWRDQQLPDGTVIWTLPDQQTYVTTAGSAWLFPTLCAPTGDLPSPRPRGEERCGERGAMMPKRRRTRADNRAHRITAERRQNRQARLTRKSCPGPAPPTEGDDDPPPF